jgi:hypothetical protein
VGGGETFGLFGGGLLLGLRWKLRGMREEKQERWMCDKV